MHRAIHEIFNRHCINTSMRTKFIDIFYTGYVDPELKIRIDEVENYSQCYEEIQARLSCTDPNQRATDDRRPDMVKARDFTKREIQVGNRIAYPVRQGSSMWMKTLVVRQITDGPSGPIVSGTNDRGRRISVKNLKNCVIIPNEDAVPPVEELPEA
ncbi:MAG: hypothetical protein ACYS7Y_03925 [Planctomycetota bacterium]|jgi:hypothetical protein